MLQKPRKSWLCIFTRWAPTNYKWSYNPYKWTYNWVTGVITPISGLITILITARGAHLVSISIIHCLLDTMHKLSHVSPIITILPYLKLTVRPLNIGRNPKGNSSSNHAFSGAMLVSGRVLQGLYIPGNATFLPSTVPNDDFMFKMIPRVDSRRWKKTSSDWVSSIMAAGNMCLHHQTIGCEMTWSSVEKHHISKT